LEEKKIKDEIKKILAEYRLGTLSTMKGDQPYTRYMIFRNEDFTLYTISSKNTEKVKDIRENHKVHILLGVEKGCFGKPYLDIAAIATIRDEKELKDHFWHENFLKYLTGPDDPNYIVIRCEPKTIRLVNHPDLDGPYILNMTNNNK
jgi:general stress protein 26